MNPFHHPPPLHNEKVTLVPLKATDFDELFALAGDPLVWIQHPNPNRYRRADFMKYFEGALDSKGAYKIADTVTGKTIGCSRFYGYDEATSVVLVGYTFYGHKYWGQGHNPAAKSLMLEYAFRFVKQVQLHVGAANLRSQIAVERLGAIKIEERVITYYGELDSLNFVYALNREP